MTDRALIVFPDDRIDEVDENGDTTAGVGSGIWAELVEAGYPRYSTGEDPEMGDECIDISVDGNGQVTAYIGEGNQERSMGPLTPRLAAWLEEL
uniref:hypothetical protein n=1 Tax=Paractinoplanes polyasparticus TaxID=2856853 RepID=UPI001C85D31C|nr:hypothetical protein [Actinoplanes polyasparticus]